MTSFTLPQVGPGHFQWNTGGWFGSSLGSSAWMCVLSFLLICNSEFMVAGVPGIGFIIVTTASLLLWHRRDRIYPFPAMIALLGVFAITFPIVWIVVSFNASSATLASISWPQSPLVLLVIEACVALFIAWCFLLERSGKITGAAREDKGE